MFMKIIQCTLKVFYNRTRNIWFKQSYAWYNFKNAHFLKCVQHKQQRSMFDMESSLWIQFKIVYSRNIHCHEVNISKQAITQRNKNKLIHFKKRMTCIITLYERISLRAQWKKNIHKNTIMFCPL